MRIVLSEQAADELEELPVRIHARVHGILERLQRWPAVSGAKPLSGRLAGRYRVRTGDYRVQFRIEAGAVMVEKIGHRARFYEE